MAIFDVKMKCVVYKNVTVECDTIEEAENDPWEYCIDEIETDQVDWEIISINEEK